MTTGMNFISENHLPDDLELFFGPITGHDTTIVFDDTWTMLDIVVAVGLFNSKTQARKNGFDKPIPFGFTIGREKHKQPHKNFWILNIKDTHDPQ